MLTRFLIKRFVKSGDNTKNSDVRKDYGYLSGFTGVFTNVLLFITKLITGMYIDSIAVMADAFNNLSDAASSVVTIFGFKMSSKPADKEHPFGHGRFEYIAAMIVSLMVLIVGLEFVKSSVKRIINPHALNFDLVTVILLTLTVFVKIWLMGFYNNIGRKINSKVMEAAALDSKSDVLATSVVVISLAAGKFTTFPLDGYIGLAVAFSILYNGFNLVKDTLNPLLGEAPDEELVNSIICKTLSYKEIMGIHDLIVHNYGPGRIVASIHAEIPHNIGMLKAHEIIDRAEKEISGELGIYMLIHMDPINIDDKEVIRLQSQVMEVIESFPYELSIHDFCITGEENCKNLIFDMVVPYDFNEKDEEGLIEEVKNEIKKRYPNYEAVITIDHQYSIMR